MMHILENYIGGRWVASASIDHLELIDPATEARIGLLPKGSPADVSDAISAANQAGVGWAGLSLEERIAALERFIAAVEPHAQELAALEQTEMGRPRASGEPWIRGGIHEFRAQLEAVTHYDFVRTVSAGPDTHSLVRRHPVGVVGVVVPWNFAVTMVLTTLAPLLASGNTVVLKPSEKASQAPHRIFEIAAGLLPAGVLNLVLGDRTSGSALSKHPDLGLLHFTGSVSAGRSVAIDSASHLRPAILELGGKDPVIVDEGVDVKAVARDVAYGSFFNSGQICTSMERIYVHRSIAPQFVDALVEEARPYDRFLGPLVDQQQLATVDSQVSDARAKGATVLLGGVARPGVGFFYPATILTDVTDDMLIMNEETFGPVAPIQVVDSFEGAIDKSSRSAFGLGATVYTNHPEHILRAQDLPAALVWINKWRGDTSGCVCEPAGQSGLGVVGGIAAFDAATRPTAVAVSVTP